MRWAYDVPAPDAHADAVDEWRETVRTTFESCLGHRGGPPGPVHLNISLREPLIPIDDGTGFDHDLGLDRQRALMVATPKLELPDDDLAAALENVPPMQSWSSETTRVIPS